MWTILTIPGYTNSGPDHWQSHWERDDPTMQRVEQRDWDHPNPVTWAAAIEAAICPETAASTVLVGHSCGSVGIAHWAAQHRGRVAGAMLVAPSDVERAGVPPALRAFGPVPLLRLPFPTVVIASEDDPHCTPERARVFARAWGSDLVFVGRAGHLNTASGHGPWPEGRLLLQQFCSGLQSAVRPQGDRPDAIFG